MRTPEWGLVAVAVLAISTWLAALLTSLPRPPPVLIVIGEPAIAPGAPWALRLLAVSPDTHAQRPVSGVVRLNDATAPIVDGTARLARAAPGAAVLELVIDEEPLVGTVEVKAAGGAAPTFAWMHWQNEVAMHTGAGGRDPLYPLDGRVSARLPADVLVLSSPPRRVSLAPRVQGPVLDDGRVLEVDRSGLRLALPAAIAGEEVTVTVTSAERVRMSCELLVDGVVHDVVIATVAATQPLSLRRGMAKPGAALVVHCGGMWPDDHGRFATAVVAASADDRAAARWVQTVAARSGAPADEPLLAALARWEGPGALAVEEGEADRLDDRVLVQAALARLRPGKLRAPRLSVQWQRAAPPPLAALYAGLSALLVLGTALLGFVRVPGRRWAVVGGALSLALVLAGLGAMLVVLAS